MDDKEIIIAMRNFGFAISLDGCCWGVTQVAENELRRGKFAEFDEVVSYLKYKVSSVEQLRILVRAVKVHDRKLVVLKKIETANNAEQIDLKTELDTLEEQLRFWANLYELPSTFRQALLRDTLSDEEQMLKRLEAFFGEIYLNQRLSLVKLEIQGSRGGLPDQTDVEWIERTFEQSTKTAGEWKTEEKKKDNAESKEQAMTKPLKFALLTRKEKSFLKDFLHTLSSDSESKNLGVTIINADHAVHLFYEGGVFWRLTDTFTISSFPTVWMTNKILESTFMQNESGNLGIIFSNRDPGLSADTKKKLQQICQQAANELSTASKDIINQKDQAGSAPLHIAVEMGAVNEVAKLLENKELNVNGKTENKSENINVNCKTALMIAAGKGDSTLVNLLLNHKEIQVNAVDIKGNDALFWAIYGGHSETAMILLARDDLELMRWPEGLIPALRIAIEVGLVNLVGEILNDWRVTAEDAHKYGKLLLKLFSDPSVDMSGCNEDKMTMLHIIASKYWYETELLGKLLQRHDIDKKQVDIHGNTFLHNLAHTGGEGLEMALLCNYDEEALEQKNDDGNTPLCVAVSSGKVSSIVPFLENWDSSINICNNKGYSPLAIAVYEGRINIVGELLSYNKVNRDWTLDDGTTLLDLAVIAGDVKMCDFLRQNGINKQKKPSALVSEVKVQNPPISSAAILSSNAPVSMATNRYSFQDNEMKSKNSVPQERDPIKLVKQNRKG